MATATTTTKSEAENGFYVVNSAAEWKKQLITKEDPTHVHKTLGILVLCSYAWRLTQVGELSDMGFATKPHLTIPTLLLHLALNATSFSFKLPAKRIASGYRIWPEYRLHSLVFLCRSLAMMFVFWCESELFSEHYQQQPQHWLNLVVILATMAAADLTSATQGKYQSGFARELDVPAAAKYFFSFAQFNATSMILLGQRRYTMLFLMVIIIQVNAFLMTVRRKNLASQGMLTTIYGLLIFGAGVVAAFEYTRGDRSQVRAVVLIANVATLLRTFPVRLPIIRHVLQDNKYGLWLAMYVLLETCVRPHMHEEMTWFRLAVVWSSNAAVILLGVYKQLREQREKRAAAIKSV